jgi:hypothetical protein
VIVRRLLKSLDALPRGLRWALFLPIGVACSLVVGSLLDAGFDAAGLQRTHAFTFRVAASRFVAGLTFVLFPALLSPRRWLVGVVMLAIGLALAVVPLAYNFLVLPYMRERLLAGGAGAALGMIAAFALGGGLALFVIRRSGRGAAA